MIKVRMFKTGEVVEVTPNVAYGLIDSGQAQKVGGRIIPEYTASVTQYPTRQIRPENVAQVEQPKKKNKNQKGYKIK